jgi:hypothetical protein
VFVTLAVVFAARSELLIRSRASARLGESQLALDPFTRKMEIARRSVSSITRQIDRSHDSVVVFVPAGVGKAISSSTGKEVGPSPPGIPPYDVVDAVLGGGLALRLFEPRLDSVVFVNRWTPDYRNFTLFIEGPGGEMAKMGRGPRSHARFSSALLDAGYQEQARDYLTALVQAFPRDRMVRLLFAAALVQTGDPDNGREQARLVIGSAPPDTLSAVARRLLSRMEATK